MIKRTLLVILAFLAAAGLHAQTFQNHLHVQSCTQGRSWTAAQLVQNTLVGEGVQVSNVRFNGSSGVINCNGIGTFYTDNNAPTTPIGLREGILITTGSIQGAPGPNSSARLTTNYSCTSHPDPALIPLTGDNTSTLFHCSVLEFDFIPQTDSVGFRYVFASEEYPEYTEESFNDIFAFFVSGPNPNGGNYLDTNIAKIPGTNQPVSIHTINDYTNDSYYIDNYPRQAAARDTLQIEYDGFTTVLTAYVHVIPCSTYHLRISLSDVNDSTFDSGVFLEAGSLSAKSLDVSMHSNNPVNNDPSKFYESCCMDVVVKLKNPNSVHRTLEIFRNHINTTNSDFTIEPSLNENNTNPSVYDFPPNCDSLVFHICGTPDGIAEGLERFRLGYRLQGECNYRFDTLGVVNVNTFSLTTSTSNLNHSPVTIYANVNGGVPPYHYEWIDMRSNDTTHTTTNSISVSLQPLRQYKVCVTDACGNTQCATCAVGPIPIFIDTSRFETTVCTGQTVTLSAPGATGYKWYWGNSPAGTVRGTTPTYTTPAITYERSFSVEARRDTLGATWINTRVFVVHVEAAPSMTLYNDDLGSSSTGTGTFTTYACSGDNVHLRATGGTTYRWGANGTFGNNASYTFLPTPATSTSSPTQTTLQVTARGPAPRYCTTQRNITINNYRYPTLNPVPDTSICTGRTFTLRASPVSASGVTYRYAKQTGTPTSWVSTGRWQNLTTNADSWYVVYASSGNNHMCVRTDTVNVHLWPLPTLTTSASPQPACSGETVTLTGGGASTYVWKQGNNTISSQATATITPTNTNATTASTISYTLQGTDVHGCQNSTTQSITVHSVPTPQLAVNPNQVCQNGTVTLSATGARYYSWNNSQWTSHPSGAFTTTRTTPTTGTVTFEVWGYNTLQRCNQRATHNITVFPYPNITLTRDADSVCAGTSTILRASGAYEYSLGDTLHFSTTNTFTVTPTSPGTTYTVYGRNQQHMCISQATIRVGVLQLPTVTLTATDTNLCLGQSATLNATGGNSYNWRAGNTSLSNHNSSLTVSPTTTTVYTVEGVTTGYSPCSTIRTIRVNVYNYPSMTAMADTGICTNSSMSLHATPQTASGVTYWYTQGGNGSALGTGSQARWTVTPANSCDYIIHASRGPNQRCQVADTVHVTVWPLPTVTATASPVDACSGEPVTLTGGGASTYVWKRGSSTIATSQTTTQSNTNTNANSATNVVYQLQGFDSHGCSNTANLTVNVHSIPTVNLTANPNPVCVGGNITLQATGARNISWDSITWSNTTPFTHPQQLNTLGNNILYAWGYNTLQRCKSRSQTTVNVLAYPAVHVTADADSVCAGTSTTLRLSGAYEYSLNDTLHFSTTTSQTVTPTGTGTTYIVYGRTASHICISSDTIRIGVLPLPTVTLTTSDSVLCNGQSATLTATGGVSYNWRVGNTLLGEHGSSLVVTPTSNTHYTVEGITTGYSPCSTTRSIDIQVYNWPTFTAMADTGVCATDGLLLRANPQTATGVTYWYTLMGGNGSALGMGSQARWNVTPTDTCDYIIHASRGPNYLCHLTDTVHVDRFPLPVLTTQATPSIICSGDTAVLSAQGAAQYTWQYSSSPLPHQQDGTAWVTPTNNDNDSLTVTYTLMATDSNQCHNSATQTVSVHSIPSISLQLPQTEFCVNDNLLRTASGARYYSWNNHDWEGPFSSTYVSSIPLPTAGYDTLHLWGSNSRFACSDSLQRTIQVFNYPVLHVTPSADTVCWGDTVTLSLSGAAQYSVNGTPFSTNNTRTYILEATTTFIVQGRLANGLCTVADTTTIHVLPLPTVNITPSSSIICQGDTVTLTANNTGTGGASGFRWYVQGSNSPLVNDSNAIQHFTPDTTTTYRVTGITEGNVRCQNNGLVTITVYQRPTLTVSPDTALCHHKTLTLRASGTSSTPDVRYSYYGPGHTGVQTRNTVASQVQWSFTADQPGTHSYVISASTGPDSLCRASDTVQVTVWALPTVTLTPSRNEICRNDEIVLHANGAVNYDWQSLNGTYQGADSMAVAPALGSTIYTVYGQDIHGCRNSDTTRVTTYDYPHTHLVSNFYDICEGSSVVLTASGAQHYSWNGGTTWNNANPTTLTDTRVLTDSTTIYVEGYDASPLCQTRDSVRIRVYSYPALTFVADTNQICFGDTVFLTASGAYQYSYDSGATWGTTTRVSYIPAAPQGYTYHVEGRSEGPGCTVQQNVQVQVHPLPNLQMLVSNDAFCIDSITTISATGGQRYRLYTNYDTVLPEYSTTHTWSRRPDTTTLYTVECLTQYNCHAIDSHLVTVWTGRFRLYCEDTIVCDRGDLAVSAQGMQYYYWNGSNVPDTHNAYTFTVDSRDTNFFSVTVEGRDSHGCHGEETLTVGVYPLPELTLSADTLGVCSGGTVNIMGHGASEYIYHWSSPTPTGDSIHSALVTDTTWFTVTGIEGHLRCSSTDSIQIVAYPLPNVRLDADKHDLCDGDTALLTATGASRYDWISSTNFAYGNTRTDSPLADSIYTVWGIEDTYYCKNSDTTVVHWFGHPAITIAADRTMLCDGDSAVLTFGGTPWYDFNESGTLSATSHMVVHPDSTTVYHLHGDLRNPRFCGSDTSITIEVFPIPDIQVTADHTEICYGDTVHLFGHGGAYYAWPTDTTHRSDTTAFYTPHVSTTYRLSGTIPNRLCYNDDSIRITVYDPRVRLNPQAWEICNGGSLDIAASGSDLYRWTDTSQFTDSSVHTFVFTNNSGHSSLTYLHVTGETANHLCQADTTISIVVYPGPSIHMTIEDRDSIGLRTWEVCAGDSVTFFAWGGYFYHFPGQSDTSRSVRHRYMPPHTEADTSVYVLYGENFNHQCSGEDSVIIIVNPLPLFDLTASGVHAQPLNNVDSSFLNVCQGDSVLLTARGGLQYSWLVPGAYGDDTSRWVVVDSTTVFELYARDQKLCIDRDTLTVTAFAIPQVRLTSPDTNICQGETVTLTAHGASRYAWGADTAFTDTNVITLMPMHDTVVYVRGNNFNGLCIGDDSLHITVRQVPTITVSADREAICWEDTAVLSVLCSESTWSWENGPYVSTPLVVTPHDSTVYHVTTRAANGCYAYDSLLIQVRPFYNVRLHGAEDVCRGDSLLFTATGSTLYQWGSDTVFTSVNSRYVLPSSNQYVIVRGTARDSVCQSADSIFVTVRERPTLYVDPETTTVCLGDSIIISASGCDQYRWMEDTTYGWHNGYHVYYPQHSETYVVTGSMHGGVCIVTAPIAMTVIDTPMVQFAGPTDICLGDSVRLTASGGEVYRWTNSTPFSTSGYFHDKPDTTGTFTYHVTSQVHTLACTGRASIDVHVHPVPVVTLTADDSVLCLGDAVTLSVSGAYQYSWDMGYTYGPTDNMVYHPTDSTLYTIYGTDSMRLCADTVSKYIVVHPLPPVRLTADTTEFCIGGSVALSASGARRYSWNGGDYTTVTTYTDSPQADTLYRLQGIDSNGCVFRDSITASLHTPFQPYHIDSHHIAVHLYPTVEASINRSDVCLGDSVRLTGTGAQHYQWIDLQNMQGNPVADIPNQSRTYTVVGTMDYGCPDTATTAVSVFLYPDVRLTADRHSLCEGDTLHLSASGAERYSWDGNNYQIDSLRNLIPPVGDNVLTVHGATANLLCEAQDTIHVHVYPYPDMRIHGATRWCERDEVILTVENPADSLHWTAQPTDPTLAGQEHSATLHLHPATSTAYTLYGSSHNCAVTLQHPVVMVPYPNLQIATSADRICIGDSIQLTSTGAELYSWDHNATYTPQPSHIFHPRESGFIAVTGTTYDTLCSVSDSLSVWVDTIPIMHIEGPDSGCVTRDILLTAHSGVPVVWSSEPHDAALDTQSSNYSIRVSPRVDIRYTITGFSGLCMGSDDHIVTTGIIPRAAGISMPMRVRRAESDITLVQQCISAEGFYWIFPDSSIHHGDYYTYQIPPSYPADTFPVQVVAYRGGCSDTATIDITLLNDELWTVNVFTPDQETNNIFYVPYINKENFYVEIFNRRGIRVYESDDPMEGWDGRSNGRPCPMGAYVYRVRTSPKYSSEVNYQYGTVTLIR